MKNKSLKEGFSLIEVLIAIFILIMALLGTSVLLIKTMGMVEVISSRLIAANLAQEGIELVRNIRDNNVLSGSAWNTGMSTGNYIIDYHGNLSSCTGDVCKTKLNFNDSGSAGLYSYDVGGTRSIYSRWIDIEQISSDHLRVVSIVEWKVKNIKFRFEAEDHLYNFY